ncbi:MAG: ABC transporter permease [Desulfobacterales bacterium]
MVGADNSFTIKVMNCLTDRRLITMQLQSSGFCKIFILKPIAPDKSCRHYHDRPSPSAAFLLLGIFKHGGILVVIIAICIADWVRYARTMRGSVLEVREEAYVMAAKASGAKDVRLLARHILPNAMPPIFVVVAVDLAVVIMLEATLSFLGVGVPLTEPSLGMMIAIGKNYLYAGMWWMIVFPGAALVLLVVGINLFADWLREELNPRIERHG